jgi:hypothetical protein
VNQAADRLSGRAAPHRTASIPPLPAARFSGLAPGRTASCCASELAQASS